MTEQRKILVICQYYAPEPFRLNDYCEELVKQGHEVTVLTGVPNYPEGKTYSGYTHGARREEDIHGVHVIRCATIPRKTGALYRLLNYCSFALSSSWAVWRNQVKPSSGGTFDVIYVNQLSPVLMACAGLVYKHRYHKKLVLYCLDLWPASLLAGGITTDSMVYKVFHYLSKKLYTHCDRILITSQSFQAYLIQEFAIKEQIIGYLPQYAESLFDELPQQLPSEFAPYMGKLNLVFAGNIGRLQNVEMILFAAERLGQQEILFHIVGSGSDVERLQGIAQEKQLANVIFHGRKPVSSMPLFYALADAMLVMLAPDPVLSLTLPGKVQSYMAAGKPVLGSIDGETAGVITAAGCGYISPAGDADALMRDILRFTQLMPVEQQAMGKRAREYYEKHFARAVFIQKIRQELEA